MLVKATRGGISAFRHMGQGKTRELANGKRGAHCCQGRPTEETVEPAKRPGVEREADPVWIGGVVVARDAGVLWVPGRVHHLGAWRDR